jgi:hypothetical protein
MLSSKDFLKFKITTCCCFLDVKPGMRVVDLAQVQVENIIAALMENKGQLLLWIYTKVN